MSHYLQMGNTVRVFPEADLTFHSKLPAKTYRANFVEQTGAFVLETVDDFECTGKVYGDLRQKAERILTTFAQRECSTGVHLTGTKGSGKTMLTRLVSEEARKRGWPTILVNQPYGGDEFSQFIQSIEGEAVILFDEFEKVYGWQEQQKLLTLLDGTYPTKKLFLLTSNERDMVDRHLHNRPGRVFYLFEFEGLSPEFVREYAEDNLHNKAEIATLVRYVEVFNFFNFDMLKAVVEEMNRYGETLVGVLQVLNIRPELKPQDSYSFTMEYGGKEETLAKGRRGFDPLKFEDDLDLRDFLDDNRAHSVQFDADMLRGFDPVIGSYRFVREWNGKPLQLLVVRETNGDFGTQELLRRAL